MSAGIVTFGGSLTNAFVLCDKTNNNMKRNNIKLFGE